MRLIITSACLALLSLAGIGPALADGDAAAGEKLFGSKGCKNCHQVVAGKTSPTGPNLLGVIGRKAGSTDYKYSPPMTKAGAKGLVWDEKSVVKYLQDPEKFLADYLGEPASNNKMKVKFPDEKERENIVAYLKSLK